MLDIGGSSLAEIHLSLTKTATTSIAMMTRTEYRTLWPRLPRPIHILLSASSVGHP